MKNHPVASRRLILALAVLFIPTGCALLQPPVAVESAPPAAPPQSQQISAALDSITQILTQLKTAQTPPVPAALPLQMPTIPPFAPAAPLSLTAVPAPLIAPASTDKETQLLALLTTALQQLNTTLQNAPTTQAQQQAAFNTGLQTAQSAAVTFGGQYGALIAAGLGILSVLIQGMTNTSKAHQTAQAANATAQTLAGKLPPVPHA